MNKNEFLAELQKHLTVLDDGEQNDILEEYSQHIGMKIGSGLSEEEAIRDFGNIKELAAQILEAYHVNPEYRKKRQEQVAKEGKKIGHWIAEALRGTARTVKSFFKKCYSKIKTVCLKLGGFVRNSLQKKTIKAKKAEPTVLSKERNMNIIEANAITKRWLSLSSAGRLISGGFRGLWHGFLWCVRWVWNIAVVLLGLISGFCALILLFSLAVLLVWLIQGYPLTGPAVFCFGAVIAFGALTVFIATLIIRKKRKNAAAHNGQAVIKEAGHA